MFNPTRRDIIVGTAAATVSALVATTTAAGARDHWSLEMAANFVSDPEPFAVFERDEVSRASSSGHGGVARGLSRRFEAALMVRWHDGYLLSTDGISWNRVLRTEYRPSDDSFEVWI